ncbi:MAG: hypothetical protein QM778_03375 [Myxococcales bacterium]
MSDEDLTCGEELAASAEVPERISALFAHVSLNLEAHAKWVGQASPEARVEHDALRKVADACRALAQVSGETAELMRSLRDLAPVPHDPAGFDRQEFLPWMEHKIALQRGLSQLLLEHASVNAMALEFMRSDGSAERD